VDRHVTIGALTQGIDRVGSPNDLSRHCIPIA
jgi:hypothetical protein